MPKKSHPSAAFPQVPRRSDGRAGVVIPVVEAGCHPKVPGRRCPEYLGFVAETVSYCEMVWMHDGCSNDLVIHHEPCGIDKDDRSVVRLCTKHHEWRHAYRKNHSMAKLHEVRERLEARAARHFRDYLDLLRGRP